VSETQKNESCYPVTQKEFTQPSRVEALTNHGDCEGELLACHWAMEQFPRTSKCDHDLSRPACACHSLEGITQLIPHFIVAKQDFKIGKRIGRIPLSVVFPESRTLQGVVRAIKMLNSKGVKVDRTSCLERKARMLALCDSPLRAGGTHVPNGSLSSPVARKDCRALAGAAG
jgi:hypothetical protein